jgi:hypothetical protein
MTDGTSGKKIVLALYGAAVLLCGILLWHGLSWQRNHLVPLPEEDRAAVAQLPREWTRVIHVEGQGWVVYVPCGQANAGDARPAASAASGQAGSLVIESDEQSPRLLCAWCDTVEEATVRKVSLRDAPSLTRLKLGEMGEVKVEAVDDGVAARFAGAPVRDYVLTWTLPSGDSLVFVPADAAREFETLRAEDGNPEGCGTGEE